MTQIKSQNDVQKVIRTFFDEYEQEQEHWGAKLVAVTVSHTSTQHVGLPVFVFHQPPELRNVMLGYDQFNMPFAHQYFLFTYNYNKFEDFVMPDFSLATIVHSSQEETELSKPSYCIGLPLPNINSADGICMGYGGERHGASTLRMIEWQFEAWWSRRFNTDYANHLMKRPSFWMLMSKMDNELMDRFWSRHTIKAFHKYMDKFDFNRFDGSYLRSRLTAKGIDINVGEILKMSAYPEVLLGYIAKTAEDNPDIWSDPRFCGKQSSANSYVGTVAPGRIELSNDLAAVKREAYRLYGMLDEYDTPTVSTSQLVIPSKKFWSNPFRKTVSNDS